MTDLEVVLGDLLRASLDDCRVRLPPLTERRLLLRMCELGECMGIELTRPPREPEPDDEPREWWST